MSIACGDTATEGETAVAELSGVETDIDFDDGNIWFSGVNDEGFKILTLFDLRMGDATITD